MRSNEVSELASELRALLTVPSQVLPGKRLTLDCHSVGSQCNVVHRRRDAGDRGKVKLVARQAKFRPARRDLRCR